MGCRSACHGHGSKASSRASSRTICSIRGRLLEVAQRLHAAATSTLVIDHGPRIAELERKIRNVSDAIARGLYSEKLATDLKVFEAELARLLAAHTKPVRAPRTLRRRHRAAASRALGPIGRRTAMWPGRHCGRSSRTSIQLQPDESSAAPLGRVRVRRGRATRQPPVQHRSGKTERARRDGARRVCLGQQRQLLR